MKTVMTITGIRPDFIRMSEIFKKLDENFNHILIHTGQHFDKMLSDVFFDELKIRKPDYNLGVGGPGKEHFHQSAEVSIKIIELIRKENLNPDIILFLGDSNSVTCAVPLKKEGYRIGHIEAGMRSGDRRMLEETNRIVCDHCSDVLFVYHEDYAEHLYDENIDPASVFIVGNTIVEVCRQVINGFACVPKRNDQILLDIHRPENFKYSDRMEWIIYDANEHSKRYNLPVRMLAFKRTMDYLEEYRIGLGSIELIDLMSYRNYLESVYHSLFIISDSGTAQEEPALLHAPVLVPRDFTERPQSVDNNCSLMIDWSMDSDIRASKWLDRILHDDLHMETAWLGEGKTSELIIETLKGIL